MTQVKQIDFLIIGAQKAASSYLHEQLRAHPDVFMPPFETPYFEDPHYARMSWSTTIEPLLDGADSRQICGLKRPDFLGRPECAPRIAQRLPHARLIVSLRDPVSRAISAYFWYVQVGLLPLLPLDTACEQLLSGELASVYPNASEILSYGCYATHIRRYSEYFPSEQMLFLLSEDIRNQPAVQLQRVYAFLNIDVDFRADLARNPKPSIYNRQRLRWRAFANRHFFYKSERLANGYRLQTQDSRLLSKAAFYAFAAVDKLMLSRLLANDKPRLSGSMRNRLTDYYSAEIDSLATILDRDLSVWTKPSPKQTA